MTKKAIKPSLSRRHDMTDSWRSLKKHLKTILGKTLFETLSCFA